MSRFSPVDSVLVDQSNYLELYNTIAAGMMSAKVVGLDIETAQPRARPGIVEMNKGKKVVFDLGRTDLCGLSIWPENHPQAFYFNLGHADAANRLSWAHVQSLLDLKPKEALWVVHNLNFEMTMLRRIVGYTLRDAVCTLQMAVSAYGPDEYPSEVFRDRDLGQIKNLLPEILRVSLLRTETDEMQQTLAKIIAKQSDAAHSYNGYVSEMAYGYGLKQAVKSFFGHNMTTYDQVLGTRSHMGELTGQEVVSYGAEDAVWCARLYRALTNYMLATNPKVLPTFFHQELPMVEVYSDVWREGVRIDAKAVRQAEAKNRARFASTARRMKALVASLLPFQGAPSSELHEREAWYRKNHARYRDAITAWARSPDHEDDFRQAHQLRGSIPNEWASSLGVPENPSGLNLGHYMPVRTLIYDLFCETPIMEQGKVQSDGWARGRLRERLLKKGEKRKSEIIDCLTEIASIEQASKLYLAPYQRLVDPETERLHPIMSSQLATRRMAMSSPNAQQLAKRGESVYVRGFYKPDADDHVLLSLDWSQIELVLAAEFSNDPEFLRCYATLPYEDLHIIAASGVLSVEEQEFRSLAKGNTNVSPHLLLTPRGETMEPQKAFKYWRTEVGKGSNFEFIYSGMLRNVGEKLGWSREQMLDATDRYKARFPQFEEWRVGLIQFAREHGYVDLPDGHRRVRYEATGDWAMNWRNKFARFGSDEINWFAEIAQRRIQSRAGNQAVNAKVQGTCATLAKRTTLAVRKRFRELGWEGRARFVFGVHDELVFSVHRSLVVEAIQEIRAIMRNHPDIISKVEIDCSPSIGLNFAPYHPEKEPLGQIELFEAPELPFISADKVGGRLNPDDWEQVVDWLFTQRRLGGA